METNLANLLEKFKKDESELEKEVLKIILSKSSETLRTAFFDGPENTPFNTKESTLHDTYSMVKGFRSGIMMYLNTEKDSTFFLGFKEEFIKFFKENLGLEIKTFEYKKIPNPGGTSHYLIISMNP